MKLCGGFLKPLREPCSRIPVCISMWMFPQMTSHLSLLILSSLAASSQLGLEDVFFSPQEKTVKEGEGVFFQCVSGESSPPAIIHWLKDGKMVTRGRHIQGEYGGGHQRKTSGTLHLFNITPDDDGVYVCVTHNPSLNISKSSKPAKLTVQGVPRQLQIIQGPDNITVAMGTEVSMHCTLRGFPVPMVHWFRNGCLLTNCSASFSLQNNGQLLTFSNVTKEDEGSYHCEASNQNETIKSQPAFLLLAEMDWRFVQQPINLTVKKGENISVTCRPPYSRPAAQVSWFKNNQLLRTAAHVTVLPNGDLFFDSIQEFDSGSYFCRASNIYLQRYVTSRPATVTVLAPPLLKVWPQLLTVPLGARVVLECQATGYPLPSISWIKRGHSKQTGGKITLGRSNATLYIQSARSYDDGAYVCEASNTQGLSRSTALLRVAVSPVIVNFIGQLSCRIGDTAVLPCKAVGILPITYTWTRERQSAVSFTEDRHVNVETGALHIKRVQSSDGGEYYCTAENRAGRHQRRTILNVLAEEHPADRDKQIRQVLSSSNTSKELQVSQSSNSMAEQQLQTRSHPHAESRQKEVTCLSSNCDATTDGASMFSPFLRGAVAELRMSPQSLGHISHHQAIQLTTGPNQPLATQTHPPMLPPPPPPQLPVTNATLSISDTEPAITLSQSSAFTSEVLSTISQYPIPHSQSHLTSSLSQFQHRLSDGLLPVPDTQGFTIHAESLHSQTTELLAEIPTTQSPPKLPAGSFLKSDSYLLTPTQSLVTQAMTRPSGSVTQLQASQSQSQQLITTSGFYPLAKTSQNNPLHQQPLPTISQIPQIHPQQSFTLGFLPKFQLAVSTIHYHLPPIQPPPSATTPQLSQVQTHSSTTEPTSAISSLPQTQPQASPTPHPLSSISSLPPHDQSPDLPTLDPEKPVGHQVNMSDQARLNVTQQGDPAQSAKLANDTELTALLKRNTSQSPVTSNDPRVLQQSPSWLPVLEKRDIPIVVGVGVSLAFIFITVTFYSVVQKNEPAPTSRAAQRNLGVPIRHERRAAGRTYENRAFEDDNCMAVIEQSPNTSDTRARPPGPSLVTVQMEPTFEDHQEESQPTLDNHSVTIETYPEPILDTKIDPSLDEEKGFSLSQPSIQLQCSEDWMSNREDNHSLCQDALPPPSSLPSPSPSASPLSRRDERLHSSLTLQCAEQSAAPIHHSLNISHGNPPLLLSHHVSLGVTSVAVDVHFYPTATVSMAVGTTTQINTASNSTSVAAPLLSPPLGNTREIDQSAVRCHQCK